MTAHSMDIRVYYEDTDAGKVMYHGTHMRYAERGRAELLRAMGYQCSDIEKEFGVLFVARHLEIEYHAPAFLDDLLCLKTSIAQMKRTSFTMRQVLTCESRANPLVSDMHVTLVAVDTNTLRPVRLPEVVRTGFEQFME